MKSRKFKIGAVGTGSIFKMCHLPGWKDIPDVEIVGVADVDVQSAKKLAGAEGIAHVFSDYRDLLKLDIDAVDICTPNNLHTPMVLAALQAGKHVICEKPLATTVREVRQMGQLADKKKLKLMTAQHQRFTSSARAIRGWVDDGGLGDVYHARVHAMRRAWLPVRPGFIDQKLSGGGPCMDIGVHALDACMWMMDFPKPVRATGTAKVNFAKGRKIPGMWGDWDRKMYSVEDFAAGFVHFENGATMVLEASWLGHQQENEDMSFQLFGTEGGVKWPSAEFATVRGTSFLHGHLSSPRHVAHPHWEELKAFFDCVTNNKPSPVPWTETVMVIAILEAIYRSSEKGGREIAVKI